MNAWTVSIRFTETSISTAADKPVPASCDISPSSQCRFWYCSKLVFTRTWRSTSLCRASFPRLWRSDLRCKRITLFFRPISMWQAVQTSLLQSFLSNSPGNWFTRWIAVTVLIFVDDPCAFLVLFLSDKPLRTLVLCNERFRAISAGVPRTPSSSLSLSTSSTSSSSIISLNSSSKSEKSWLRSLVSMTCGSKDPKTYQLSTKYLGSQNKIRKKGKCNVIEALRSRKVKIKSARLKKCYTKQKVAKLLQTSLPVHWSAITVDRASRALCLFSRVCSARKLSPSSTEDHSSCL